MKSVHIAVSMGDPCGVGPEVLAKSAPIMRREKKAAFFIFGDSRILSKYGFRQSGNIILIDLKNSDSTFIPGKPSKDSARASLEYLVGAVKWIKDTKAQALVSGPISKENVVAAGFSWPGHTEFLQHAFGSHRVEMVFVSPVLKVVLLTRHMSLIKAVSSLNKNEIFKCGSLVFDLLKNSFKLRRPKIAVCGLNPHAGEAGLFGKEEEKVIAPAIKKLNKKYGPHFFGPYPADTVFLRAVKGKFDLVIAMYHDQGLVPFKLLEFESGVNLTAGLPIVRTSPVHGTAFDIAGRNLANPGSMSCALKLASELALRRFL